MDIVLRILHYISCVALGVVVYYTVQALGGSR